MGFRDAAARDAGCASGLDASGVAAPLRAADEDFHVFTDSPRLLLTKQRLRLLQRERERQSMRWQQFDALVSGGAPMPETGARAGALLSGRRERGGGAEGGRMGARAPARSRDLRQLALVFDWCGTADDRGPGGSPRGQD